MWSEKVRISWKTPSVVEICLQLFGGIYLPAVISFSPLLSVFLRRVNLNAFFVSTKSREELRAFLYVHPADFMNED